MKKAHKILTATLIAVIVTLPFAHTWRDASVAHAQELVIEVGPNLNANQISAQANVITAEMTTGLFNKEFVIDPAFWAFIKSFLVQALTDSIIQWINSGFEGAPTFLADPTSFLLDMANQASGFFIKQYGLEAVCDPYNFTVDVQIALLQSSYSTNVERFSCTIGDAIDNVNAFVDDFKEGGLDGWLAFNQPENNPFGAYVMASAALAQERSEALAHKEREIVGANGFLSLRFERCAAHASDGTCLRYEVETPGKAIVGELEKTLASPIAQLDLADELEEALIAILQALINQLINDGLRSTFSGGNPPTTDPLEIYRQTLIDEINRRLGQTNDPVKTSCLQALLTQAQNATTKDELDALYLALSKCVGSGGGSSSGSSGGDPPPPPPPPPPPAPAPPAPPPVPDDPPAP